MKTILLLEDDENLNKGIGLYLTRGIVEQQGGPLLPKGNQIKEPFLKLCFRYINIEPLQNCYGCCKGFVIL